MAGRTELIEISPGHVIIQTIGLRELSRALSDFTDREIPRAFGREMKAAGEDLAEAARAHALSFSESGDFASSIGIYGGRSGIFLRSTDPGAGPIEFAGSGNPHAPIGDPPRALFAAINDELPNIEPKIANVIERMAQTVMSQQYTTPD